MKGKVIKPFFVTLVALLGVYLAWGAAAASAEEFLPGHKLTITENGRKSMFTADGGKNFGKVSAILETTSDKTNRIKSIILKVDGKELVIPKEQFDDLRAPLIKTWLTKVCTSVTWLTSLRTNSALPPKAMTS